MYANSLILSNLIMQLFLSSHEIDWFYFFYSSYSFLCFVFSWPPSHIAGFSFESAFSCFPYQIIASTLSSAFECIHPNNTMMWARFFIYIYCRIAVLYGGNAVCAYRNSAVYVPTRRHYQLKFSPPYFSLYISHSLVLGLLSLFSIFRWPKKNRSNQT